MVALLCAQPIQAAEQGWLTSRRAWGVALFSGSAVLLKKSWDFHQQADESYALYRRAATEREAELFFDRADNRDTKSQMSWMAAAAFALAGWQLMTLGDEREARALAIKKPTLAGVEVEPQLQSGRVGLRFKRRFF